MIISPDPVAERPRIRRPWLVAATLALLGLPVGVLSKVVDYAPSAVAEAGNGFGPYLLILLPFLLHRDLRGFWPRVFATQVFVLTICLGYYAAGYFGDGSFTWFFLGLWVTIGAVGAPVLAVLTRSILESERTRASLSCGALCGVFIAEIVLVLAAKLPGRLDETMVLIPINIAAVAYVLSVISRAKKARWSAVMWGSLPIPMLFWLGILTLRLAVALLTGDVVA